MVRPRSAPLELNCPGPIKIVLFSLVSMLIGNCFEMRLTPAGPKSKNFGSIPWNASRPSRFLTAADRDLNSLLVKNKKNYNYSQLNFIPIGINLARRFSSQPKAP